MSLREWGGIIFKTEVHFSKKLKTQFFFPKTWNSIQKCPCSSSLPEAIKTFICYSQIGTIVVPHFRYNLKYIFFYFYELFSSWLLIPSQNIKWDNQYTKKGFPCDLRNTTIFFKWQNSFHKAILQILLKWNFDSLSKGYSSRFIRFNRTVDWHFIGNKGKK